MVVDFVLDHVLSEENIGRTADAIMALQEEEMKSSPLASMEAEYREKLAACTDPAEKPILQNALVQALSLRAKKAQMKNEFISKLRFISDRATETLAELEAPGALEEIQAAVWGGREPDLPENPEEGAGGDAPDGSKNRANQTDGAGQGADSPETKP